jgi:hypothetical protein
MPQKKQARERETVAQIGRIHRRTDLRCPQKGRKAQEPVLPRPARFAGHGATGFWRYIGKLRGRAGRRTPFEVKAETKLGKEVQFEANHVRARPVRIEQMGKHLDERRVDQRVRVAFRQ